MDVNKEKLPGMNVSHDIATAQSLVPPIQAAVAKKVADGSAPGLDAVADDRMDVSGVASLASRAASMPDVRDEKVAEVRAALAAGTYEVSSSDVAQSLIDEMLGKKP